MSAEDVQVLTIIVPNPQYGNSKSARIVSSDISYSLRLRSGFRTISSNNPNKYDDIEGLLYLPTLSPENNEVCSSAQSLIPQNVTTLADFPTNQNYPLVAIFPWTTSADCTEAYLAQARADAVRGAFAFQPSMGDSGSISDNSWGLGDSDRWKSDNQYPIYAISSATGVQLLEQLELYSGNMSSVPNGALLANSYDSRDYPRLFVHVDIQGGTHVPSLWIFLIIVLAILLGIVIFASIIMHIIQRHQRNVLQRRLQRGEVDLESLGIKKMNVPQEKIDEMPKYVFTEGVEAPAMSAGAPKAAAATQQTFFSQTTCPICLDDFVSNETEVRELPCKHIFHPECIDLFLRDNSSLCPMCKISALPPGYCPIKVTNLMVRRERLVRRMRERRREGMAAAIARASDAPPPPPSTRLQAASLWAQRRLRVGRGLPTISGPNDADRRAAREQRASTALPPSTTTDDVEMTPVAASETTAQPLTMTSPFNARRQTMAIPPQIAAQGATARRAWRRERLARQQDEQYMEQAETVRAQDEGRPLWRRVVGRVMPGTV